MKTRIKLLTALAVALSISLAAFQAYAFTGDRGPKRSGDFLKKLTTVLGLSDQQKQQVKEILERKQTQTQPLVKQMMAERRALRDLIHADSLDEEAIRAQAAKVAALQADLAVQRARMGQDLRSVLTPEQVKKYKVFQKERKAKMDKRRGSCDKQMAE